MFESLLFFDFNGGKLVDRLVCYIKFTGILQSSNIQQRRLSLCSKFLDLHRQ